MEWLAVDEEVYQRVERLLARDRASSVDASAKKKKRRSWRRKSAQSESVPAGSEPGSALSHSSSQRSVSTSASILSIPNSPSMQHLSDSPPDSPGRDVSLSVGLPPPRLFLVERCANHWNAVRLNEAGSGCVFWNMLSNEVLAERPLAARSLLLVVDVAPDYLRPASPAMSPSLTAGSSPAQSRRGEASPPGSGSSFASASPVHSAADAMPTPATPAAPTKVPPPIPPKTAPVARPLPPPPTTPAPAPQPASAPAAAASPAEDLDDSHGQSKHQRTLHPTIKKLTDKFQSWRGPSPASTSRTHTLGPPTLVAPAPQSLPVHPAGPPPPPPRRDSIAPVGSHGPLAMSPPPLPPPRHPVPIPPRDKTPGPMPLPLPLPVGTPPKVPPKPPPKRLNEVASPTTKPLSSPLSPRSGLSYSSRTNTRDVLEPMQISELNTGVATLISTFSAELSADLSALDALAVQPETNSGTSSAHSSARSEPLQKPTFDMLVVPPGAQHSSPQAPSSSLADLQALAGELDAALPAHMLDGIDIDRVLSDPSYLANATAAANASHQPSMRSAVPGHLRTISGDLDRLNQEFMAVFDDSDH